MSYRHLYLKIWCFLKIKLNDLWVVIDIPRFWKAQHVLGRYVIRFSFIQKCKALGHPAQIKRDSFLWDDVFCL